MIMHDSNPMDVEDDHTLVDPHVSSARIGRPTSPNSNLRQSKYVPKVCEVCGLTQKELHQQLNHIHDPSDPRKCCLRGPEYIGDKNIREKILQYNLRHPSSEKQNGNTKKSFADPIGRPPANPTLPTRPQCNSATNDQTPYEVMEQEDTTTPELYEPSIKSLSSTSNQPDNEEVINSLITYIEDLPSDQRTTNSTHNPKVASVKSEQTNDIITPSEVFYDAQTDNHDGLNSLQQSTKNKDSPVPLSLFYRYQK